MTKSEIINMLSRKQSHLSHNDIESSIKLIVEQMGDALAEGQRIEIRGFGSFSLHYRRARQGRNPRTGESLSLESKYVPYFKPGKELREQVDLERIHHPIKE